MGIRFNTASGMRSHVTQTVYYEHGGNASFNTASGMRSHVTAELPEEVVLEFLKFQYRKRYEITCDIAPGACRGRLEASFNTASGMRSHVTSGTPYQKGGDSDVSIPQAV